VHSTNQVLMFVFVMTTIVAVGLTGLREATKPLADANEAIFNKKGVLAAVKSQIGEDPKNWDNAQVESEFAKVKGYVFDYEGNPIQDMVAIDLEKNRDKNNKLAVKERAFPVWVYEKGGEKFYVVTVYGKGLWDKIWGTVALKSDLNTIVGVSFDHKGETPGLGAEIKDSPAFKSQFEGRKIYNDAGEYKSIIVRKGGAKDKTHEVDSISGATITGDGVTDMFVEGLANYKPVLDAAKNMK
jgi:Na+-transporting NADH:ubiquinone oxidoreductase subunit C